MPRKKTHQEFIEEVFGLVSSEYEVLGKYKGNKTKILMKHNKCGYEFEMRPNHFLRGTRCPKCGGTMKKTAERFKEDVFKLVGDTYYVLSEYKNNSTKVLIKHNECNREFEMKPNAFLNGQRCPHCFGNHKKTIEQFKEEVKKLVDNEYVVLGEYINTRTKIVMKHSVCEFEWGITPSDFLAGYRCPKCAGKVRKDTDYFKKELFEIVGDEYSVLGNYKNNHTKILFKHNKCGYKFDMTPKNFTNLNQRCPRCNESKGEKKISNILDDLNITYEPQYKFDDCRNINPLPFDHAVFNEDGSLKFLIEYQGIGHYEPIEVWGGEEHLTYVKNNDLIKKDYCERNNIKLIEIPYWEFDNMEKIIKDALMN